ncbi:capsule biosynthesis GfcC family protein [Vibrio rhizosphaerae]|uniref:capsule biosynthesis GfcC family protein n=1 Tax=Vibrio rhizosphaerae TaxID=398736 RepID=UPI00056E2A88|nr:capsule biosynthesis GfcC family protein [Vibrio rhizosphaerae]
MKSWKVIVYLTLCISTGVGSVSFAASSTDVEIHFESSPQRHLTYNHRPRLDEVVLQALNKTDADRRKIDWFTSGIYDINVELKLKQQVFGVIAKQQAIASKRYHGSWFYWSQLRNSLESLHYAKRIFHTIDPDATRLSLPLNPKLTGNWLMTLKYTPKDVLVLGGVTKPGKQTWQPRLDAGSYAQTAGLFDNTISKVTVIQPDGKVEQHQTGYWNYSFSEIAPGAIVYVPLPVEELPVIYPNDRLQNPNDLVVELLRNRLP